LQRGPPSVAVLLHGQQRCGQRCAGLPIATPCSSRPAASHHTDGAAASSTVATPANTTLTATTGRTPAGAHASFFVIGANAERWPWLVEREAPDGDTVGDHTWTRPNLTDLSATGVSAELAQDKNLIKMLTGEAPTLWRPPYQAFSPSVVAIASRLGMKMQLWSDTTGDWQLPGTEVIVLRVMAALHNGMVVLLHDGRGYTRSETVAAVAILIPELEAAGYRLAALPSQGMSW
jgi:peptidoglycan/xylan/chitin deacetylase (PgdA/CDA1 family)